MERPKIRRQGVVVNNMSKRSTSNIKRYGGYHPVGDIPHIEPRRWWKEMNEDGVMMLCTGNDQGDTGQHNECYDMIDDEDYLA